MIATFIGGGSLRLLPILRGIMGETPEVFRGGEIRLLDRRQERAQAVARLLRACPEYQNVGCSIVCHADIDEALDQIDVLYLTMAARREPTETLAAIEGQKYGYLSSDQLSINGAFLSLRLGGTILGFARKMEKLCPKAMMLIFPNPVSVYSVMVNTYTNIKALGICGGFNNHRWDLSRLLGRDEYDPDWNVVAAGVNHLSLILRGTYRGEDIFGSLFPRILSGEPLPLQHNRTGSARIAMEIAQKQLREMYLRFGTMIFSTEFDGLGHIATQEIMNYQKMNLETHLPFDPVKAQTETLQNENRRFEQFIRQSLNAGQINWESSWPQNPLYGKDITDISIPVFRALAGLGTFQIVASRPNNGAVAGFPDNAALEYTMELSADEIKPLKNQYVPHPFQGLIASLSEFQTLQAQAIAEHDPKIFADALEAYPLNQWNPKRKEFFCRMFDLYTDLDPHMRKARCFFEG